MYNVSISKKRNHSFGAVAPEALAPHTRLPSPAAAAGGTRPPGGGAGGPQGRRLLGPPNEQEVLRQMHGVLGDSEGSGDLSRR